MTENILDLFKSEIKMYLQNISNRTILCIFNYEGEIRETNATFRDLFFPAPSGGEKTFLEDILYSGDLEDVSLPQEEDYVRQKLKFRRSSGTPYFVESIIFHRPEFYLLLGEFTFTSAEDALNKISQLNQELDNKSRELTKKNRELKKAKARVEKVMRTDKLTKLANRRAFMEFLKKTLAQSRRYDNNLTIIMLDLDNFKEINDSYGHPVGDQVLRKVGDILAENVREGDMAARFGGDEFIILMPQTAAAEAVNMAHRIRKKVKSINLSAVKKPPTLSLGITEFKGEESAEDLLNRADKAMYEAKQAGKDKIISRT